MRIRWYRGVPEPAAVFCSSGHLVARFRTWLGGLKGLERLRKDHRCQEGDCCPDYVEPTPEWDCRK